VRVLSVFGTRPEAIKMAPVIAELGRRGSKFDSRVCVTAQHREILDQVLTLFSIEPNIDLDLMTPEQTLSDLTARSMQALTGVLQDTQPDIVLVQGDTTTVMAAALAAFYEHIPVGHVEAGLRTGDRYRPFPEEINRRLADVLSSVYFAPTQTAAQALLREGVPEASIHVTGNTVIDALLTVTSQPEPGTLAELLDEIGTARLVLVTAHRRENFGAPFEEICRGLRELVHRNDDLVLVYPVHPNPNVREPVFRHLQDEPGIHLIDPLPYAEFSHLMNRASLILTDSGGIQEEAPALGKPVLVLRRETERPEAVEAGTVRLIGPDAEAIVQKSELLLNDAGEYQRMARAISPYGDGHAAEKIVDVLDRGW